MTRNCTVGHKRSRGAHRIFCMGVQSRGP